MGAINCLGKLESEIRLAVEKGKVPHIEETAETKKAVEKAIAYTEWKKAVLAPKEPKSTKPAETKQSSIRQFFAKRKWSV